MEEGYGFLVLVGLISFLMYLSLVVNAGELRRTLNRIEKHLKERDTSR